MGNTPSARPAPAVKPILRTTRPSNRTSKCSKLHSKPHFVSRRLFDRNIIVQHTMRNRSRFSSSTVLALSRMATLISSLTTDKRSRLLMSPWITPRKMMHINRYSPKNAFSPPTQCRAHNKDGPGHDLFRGCEKWMIKMFKRRVRFSNNVRVQIIDQ